jgi:tetratricopeptide (TPR) repeat protein
MKKTPHIGWLGRTAAAAALLLPATPCRADEASDRAAAEALYELGQKLLKDGNYAEACPKLEASNSLDPGVGTLLLLGDCWEKAGKLASAWATFKDAAALARSHNDPERVNIGELRASALRPRLAYVEFEVSADDRVPGFELRRGGATIAPGSWGVALPTDPGTYEIVARAPAHESWRSTLEVPARLDAPLVVAVPALRASRLAAMAPAARPVSGRAVLAPARLENAVHEDAGAPGSGQRLFGLLGFGAGAAAGIAGGVVTYLAAKKNHDSKSDCRQDDPNLCAPAGVKERHDAKNLATLATVLAVSGGVLAAAGVTLFVTAPSADEKKPTGLLLGMDGRF